MFRKLVLASLLAVGVACVTPASTYPVYDELSPYGEWWFHPRYGNVFTPYAPVGWQPYTLGHWAWSTFDGWVWVSDDPFGWTTNRAGRWAQLDGRWAWLPSPGVLPPRTLPPPPRVSHRPPRVADRPDVDRLKLEKAKQHEQAKQRAIDQAKQRRREAPPR